MVDQPPLKRRSFIAAVLFSVLLGKLGIDRFYLGYIGLGVLKLLTIGGCGIWWLIDIILIVTGSLRDADGNDLER
jgi:TM2 domain-containing membrane protein YozV